MGLWKDAALRANRDTLAALGYGDRRRAWISPAIFFFALVFIRLISGSAQMSDEWNWGLSMVGALVCVYVPLFIYNLVRAPNRLYRETAADRNRLAQAIQQHRAVLETSYADTRPYRHPTSKGTWFRVGVNNSGPSEARGVKVWLQKSEPRPRGVARYDLPYRVSTRDLEEDLHRGKDIPEIQVAPLDEELFTIFVVRVDRDRKHIVCPMLFGVDTKNNGKWYPWPLYADTSLRLYYEVTAFNADAVRFSIIVRPHGNRSASVEYCQGWGDDHSATSRTV